MDSERTATDRSSRSRFSRLLPAFLLLLAGACATADHSEDVADAEGRTGSNSERAATHIDRGDALFYGGQFAEAMAEYREAIRLDPNSGRAHAGLANALVVQGELEPALAEFREATRLEPTNADLWLQLAQLQERLGRGEAALHSLETGLEADSGDAGILNQLGWFYATTEDPALRDPAKALEYARRAVEASGGGDPNILDTLAEAYYANREFEKAIETEERALNMAPGTEALLNQLEKFRKAKAAESAR